MFAKYLAFLITIILFQKDIQGDLTGCNDVVLSDCDRNYCENQIINGLPTSDLCQLACQLAENSFCLSWAYSNENKVKVN